MKFFRSQFLVLVGISGSTLAWSAVALASSAHPLDPLSKKEIAAAVETLKAGGRIADGCFFPIVTLHEPAKEDVRAFQPGGALRREAFVVVLNRGQNQTFEAVVDVQERQIVSWKSVPGVQPAILDEEVNSGAEIVRADPRWQEAMRKRGIIDLDQVMVEIWAPGHVPSPAAPKGARLVRGFCFLKDKAKNPYPRPIEGVVAVVDMNQRKVVELVDTGVVPIATQAMDFDEKSAGPLRKAPNPLRHSQPRGPGFTIQGQEIQWQKWRFRYALHPREGLVLYTVGYEDGGKLRPILYRVSLSEMVVPYADPDVNWHWRSAFDQGEYGVGRLASSLNPRNDAPDNAVLLDATFAGDTGEPYQANNVVAIYEADGGILWRHGDWPPGIQQSRRARQLVIMYVATVGNYDYAFHWIFHQDGRLEAKVSLTGIVLPKGVSASTCSICDAPAEGGTSAAGGAERHGHLVAEKVVAPHHQHFMNFRLDFDVDGAANSVAELNARALPAGPDNPQRNAFVVEKTLLRTEQEARRDLDFASGRKWTVFNPGRKNAVGHFTAFALIPHDNAVPYALPDSPVRKRAQFLNHQLWVTRYHPAEMNGAGYYPNQGPGGDGLPKWTKDNESTVNEDVVVWYTLGVTHHPRTEDWPIMPTTHVGFELIPTGFFDRNPALDVPISR